MQVGLRYGLRSLNCYRHARSSLILRSFASILWSPQEEALQAGQGLTGAALHRLERKDFHKPGWLSGNGDGEGLFAHTAAGPKQ